MWPFCLKPSDYEASGRDRHNTLDQCKIYAYIWHNALYEHIFFWITILQISNTLMLWTFKHSLVNTLHIPAQTVQLFLLINILFYFWIMFFLYFQVIFLYFVLELDLKYLCLIFLYIFFCVQCLLLCTKNARPKTKNLHSNKPKNFSYTL